MTRYELLIVPRDDEEHDELADDVPQEVLLHGPARVLVHPQVDVRLDRVLAPEPPEACEPSHRAPEARRRPRAAPLAPRQQINGALAPLEPRCRLGGVHGRRCLSGAAGRYGISGRRLDSNAPAKPIATPVGSVLRRR